MEHLNTMQLNNELSRAANELDAAMRCVINAQNELCTKFSGESFQAYQQVLADIHSNISIIRWQLDDLYR